MKNSVIDRAQNDIIQDILKSLKEDKIPWVQPWNSNNPTNAITGKEYNNTNRLLLTLRSNIAGFKDHRWATFKQAQDKGWKIKKGSVGSWIYHVKIYDPDTGLDINDKSLFENKTVEERLEIRDRLKKSVKCYKVFNGDQIDGIPAIKYEQRKKFTNEIANSFSQEVLENMQLKVNDGQSAFYAPLSDELTMPVKDAFFDEQYYYSTLFHEIGHATGHSSRLDRNLLGSTGTEDYAKEELVAELNSMLLSLDLGLELDPVHIEQHKAYCQSWYNRIQEDGDVFFTAVNNAQKARQFILEKGNYEKYKSLVMNDVAEVSNVITYYHGSDTKFDQFTLEHLGRNGKANGFGTYLADTKEMAEIFAVNHKDPKSPGYVYSVSADLNKELSADKRTLSNDEIIQLVEKLQARGTDILSNYGDVAYEGYTTVLNAAVENLDVDESDLEIINGVAHSVGDYQTVAEVLNSMGYTHSISDLEYFGGQKGKQIVILNPTTIKIHSVDVVHQQAVAEENEMNWKVHINDIEDLKSFSFDSLEGDDKLVIYEPKELPKDWKWNLWSDGSGSLESPEGKKYFSFDMSTGELKIGDTERWSHVDDLSWVAIINEGNSWINENVLVNNESGQEMPTSNKTLNSDNKITLDDMKNSVSIVEYAEHIGFNAVATSGGLMQLVEHDSCKIYPNNTYYRFSSARGGSVVDFIMEFEDVDMKGAVAKLQNYYYEQNPEHLGTDTNKNMKAERRKSFSSAAGIEIPAPAGNNKNVFAYLTKTRCIDASVVREYFDKGILYQDELKNCVWLGKHNGKVMYATKRSSSPKSSFKGDVPRSFKEVGIYINNKSESLVITESAIDQMSYQCLENNPKQHSYLSVAGLANAEGAVNFHMNAREEAKDLKRVIIAFDNDSPAEEAVLKLNDYFKDNYPDIEVYVNEPQYHDFNEDLQVLRNEDYSPRSQIENSMQVSNQQHDILIDDFVEM